MTHKMDRYVQALGGHPMVPAHMLRENVRTMRTLEDSFRQDLKGMLVALGRKDMSLVERAIKNMEQSMDAARNLVKRVNEEDNKPFEKKDKKDEDDSDSDDDEEKDDSDKEEKDED